MQILEKHSEFLFYFYINESVVRFKKHLYNALNLGVCNRPL